MLNRLPDIGEQLTELDVVLRAASRHQRVDYVPKFEADLAAFTGIPHPVVVSSDCSAVSTLIGSLGLSAGHQVIVAAHLRQEFVFPILFSGLVPVFVDCLNEDFSFDYNAVSAAMTDKVKAIFLSAPWGCAHDFAKLCDAVEKAALTPVIADITDCFELDLAHRSLLDGVDIGLLSLTENVSPLSTGEGGAILFRDATLAGKARSYLNFADLKGLDLGINQKLSSMQAALGSYRLDQFQKSMSTTQKVAQRAEEKVMSCGLKKGPISPFGNFIILRHSASALFEDFDKVCQLPCAHKLPASKAFICECPKLDQLAQNYCALPIYLGTASRV